MYRHGSAREDSDRLSGGRVPRRILAVAVVILVLLVGSVIAIRMAYFDKLNPVSNSQAVEIVTIKSGTPSTVIGETLQQRGLIRSATIFQWYIRTNNVRDKLQAGTYALRPSMSVQQIVEVMVDGSVKSDLVTILPGQRIDQVRQTLINAGFAPDAVDAALDPSQYAGHPALTDKPAGASLEGFIFPDSYQKTEGTDPAVVVKEALNEMAGRLTPELRAAYAAQGLTIYQAVTLASMVEKEVSNPSDRAQAAQVFLKRLREGVDLGSDVTAFYGAIIDGKEPTVNYDSPYNTRLHPGLPVGPIATVSNGSLQAIAKPASTDWLYFVAGDDGVTYFSKTLQEHESLTEQHCRELCAL